MSATNNNLFTKLTIWVARVIVLGALAYLLFALLINLMWRTVLWASDILYLVYLGIALAGCIASWWRPRLAGIILVLISFLLGSGLGLLSPWGVANVFAWTWQLGLPFLVAGVLFLVSWWFSRNIIPSALPSAPIS